MRASPNNLHNLFSITRAHVCPISQRRYVWTKERQWEPLWDDLRNLAIEHAGNPPGRPPRPHFLGAAVFDRLPHSYDSPFDMWTVIDGQQRLTTLQILLAAVRDVAGEQGVEDVQSDLATLTMNKTGTFKHPNAVLKVWPTREDIEAFRIVVTTGDRDKVAALTEPALKKDNRHLIAAAYLFFVDQARTFAAEYPGGPARTTALLQLYNTLAGTFTLIGIEVDEDDDPQAIFEALNDRGTPLDPSDLVKNFLIGRATRENRDDPDAVTELHQRHWAQFEGGTWQEKEAAGRLYRRRIDLFLAHYLTMQGVRDADVPVESLFASFRQWVQDPDSAGKLSTAEHLQQIDRYAQVFASFSAHDPESAEGLFFGRLRTMQSTPPQALFLWLYGRLQDGLDPARLARARAAVDSYLVRRTICHLTTKDYNRLFPALLKEVKEAPDAPDDALVEQLTAAPVNLGETDRSLI